MSFDYDLPVFAGFWSRMMNKYLIIFILLTVIGCSPSNEDLKEEHAKWLRKTSQCAEVAKSLNTSTYEYDYDSRGRQNRCEVFVKGEFLTYFSDVELGIVHRYLLLKSAREKSQKSKK